MKIEALIRKSAFVFLSLALFSAHGSDYYVSTQGNDSNSGTSSQPLRTITKAYSLASAGTTITVMPGVYTDYQSGWGLHLGKNGTSSSPITLRSQVRGGAIIDGQNASDRNEAIYLDGSYNIVDGFEIRGGPKGGITIWGNYNQLLNNEIHHNGNPASSSGNGQDGVYSSESTRNNVYLANYIHDNGRTGSNLDHGLYLCGDNEMVINNVLIRNAAYGLQIAGYSTVSNMKVHNNVMAYNGRSGIILWMAVSNVDIKNNILFQNGSYGIDSNNSHGSGIVVDHNLVYGNSSGNYNFTRDGSDYSYSLGTTISSTPLFVNSTSSGFDPHLGSGSPAINAGLNLSSIFNTDIDGTLRPASGNWDMGAYQKGTTDTTPPSVSLTAPAKSATVLGSAVAVSATASDNVGVVGVQFKLDGANLGAEDTSAPYAVTWNTTTLANGSHTLTAVARDAAGNNTSASSVSVTVNNNTAPTISSIANKTINASTSTGPIAFTVSDVETAAGSLTVTGGSSNPTLVPAGGILFGGSGANRTVTVNSVALLSGTATITLTVSDGSLSRSTSFTLTVNPLAAPVVTLTAPASGASYTAPASIGLAAAVTANGNTITKVQFFAGSTLLSEDTTAPYSFAWSGVIAGSYNLNAKAVYNGGSTVTSPSVVVAVATAPPSGSLSLDAGSGTITAPFVIANGTVSQPAYTSTVGAGGRAAYAFTIATAGDYTLSALVGAPNDGANSFWVNIDAEPVDPTMTWDIPITSGLTDRTVSWRGNGTPSSNQFAPKVFTLSAGTHQLIVRGREGNCQLGTITFAPYGISSPPVVVLTAPTDGASYAASSTIDLAAAVNSNGNTITKIQFFQGTTLIGEDATAPYNYSWSGVTTGNYALRARAVYGASGSVVSAAVNVTVSAAPPASGVTFASTSGTVTAPFVAGTDTISQPAYTSSVSAGGRAAYNFTLATAGDYVVSALVNAPDDGANSFWVNIDAEPTDPKMAWDVPLTAGLTATTASWRGTGTPDKNEFAPKVFTLTAGTHQLIVRGREGNCQLGTITIAPAATASIAAQSVASSPSLHIAVTNGVTRVSWPADLTGYVLQSKSEISETGFWSDASDVPEIIGQEWVVIMPYSRDGGFLRLRAE